MKRARKAAIVESSDSGEEDDSDFEETLGEKLKRKKLEEKSGGKVKVEKKAAEAVTRTPKKSKLDIDETKAVKEKVVKEKVVKVKPVKEVKEKAVKPKPVKEPKVKD